MNSKVFRYATVVALSVVSAFSASFVNGNFETGDANGWTVGGGYRGDVLNPSLNVNNFLPGGSAYDASIASSHSSIVTPGLDPNTGNALNHVYSGNYSWRVEDTTNGGYASVISQTVRNYTDPQIFFAWAAVLEGAHGATDAATLQIVLSDLTKGDQLVSREYNAGTTGSGVDARFNYDASTGYYWTPWQVENITLPADRIGDDFTLSVLAADCQPTGHTGYAYLDGFGAVNPPPVDGNAPEPSTFALLGAGLGAVLLKLRRRTQ
jgi:PEP-CTERM motif